MDILEKKNLVYALVDAVQSEILTAINLGKIPDEWDGIELRWFIAEKFNGVVFKDIGGKKRKAEYNNIVLVNNI